MQTRRLLRLMLVLAWFGLALGVALPALAQGGDDTPTPEVQPPPPDAGAALPQGDGSASTSSTAPEDLDDIAVKLAPLLVGAALIERTLEFLFNWVERAMLDVTHRLHQLSLRMAGIVEPIDFEAMRADVQELMQVLSQKKVVEQSAIAGDPDSRDPDDWSLETLKVRLGQAQSKLAEAENVLQNMLKSKEYVSQKKMLVVWLGIGFGIFLALVAELRLFQAMGVAVDGWFEGPFDVLDLILAGILMGLGTDWVHQLLQILTNGQNLLGNRAKQAQFDAKQLGDVALAAVESEFEARVHNLEQDVGRALSGATSSEPPPEPPETPH